MKRAAGLAGLVLTLATGAAASPPPDTARLALAQRLAAEFSAFMTQSRANEAIIEVMIAWEEVRLAETMPGVPSTGPQIPIVQLDVPQLYASLKAGAAVVGPRFDDAAAAHMAQTSDAKTLGAVVEFYGRPGERALQAHRLQSLDRSAARDIEMAQMFMRGSPSGQDAAQEMAKIVQDMGKLGAVAQTPEEAAFAKTPAGQAFPSGVPFAPLSPSVWPDMIAAAESDYCARRPCDEAAHKFFAALSAADFAKVYDPGKAVATDSPWPPAESPRPHGADAAVGPPTAH
jgi:hypothetical protein